MHNENIRRRKREMNRSNKWGNNDWEFPQDYIRHQQTTDPGSSENLVITCDATIDTFHNYSNFNNCRLTVGMIHSIPKTQNGYGSL